MVRTSPRRVEGLKDDRESQRNGREGEKLGGVKKKEEKQCMEAKNEKVTVHKHLPKGKSTCHSH